MSLFKADKISFADARLLLGRLDRKVGVSLAELRTVEQDRERQRQEQAQIEALEQLARTRQDFRVVDEVELWGKTFNIIRRGYRFLVLDGPSGMGKTLFARSKCPRNQEVLHVNCAAGGEPDLRQFEQGKHGLVIFHEIAARSVAAQRKLFQAGTDLVTLGTRSTIRNTYTVFVHRVRFVCVSNNWAASLQRLSAADRSWVEANSVLVRCDRPLWVT